MAATPPAVPDDATYRLMVNKLVFTDFKSYAGEKEIGPFHSRFSAVVGPNGSGKSNVIDGMQFVFGKRASDLRFKITYGSVLAIELRLHAGNSNLPQAHTEGRQTGERTNR